MRTCHFATALVLVALASGTAWSAPETPKQDATTERARQLHQEGDALLEKGEYTRARAAYLAAWSLKKHWQIAGVLGQVEMRLKLHRDAAEHLAFALREAETPPADLRKLYQDARVRVGTLQITGSVPGAEIVVDGKPVGATPLADPVFVEPGEHTVEARHGAAFASSTVTVKQGEARPIAMAFAPPAAGGTEKPIAAPLPPKPIETPRPLLWPIAVGGGLAAVGLGVGIGFTLAANGKGRDVDGSLRVGQGEPTACYQNTSAACVKLGGAVDQLDAFTTVAVVGYAVGIAASAGTLAYVLWPRSAASGEASARVSAAPWMTLSGGGLGVAGRF